MQPTATIAIAVSKPKYLVFSAVEHLHSYLSQYEVALLDKILLLSNY